MKVQVKKKQPEVITYYNPTKGGVNVVDELKRSILFQE